MKRHGIGNQGRIKHIYYFTTVSALVSTYEEMTNCKESDWKLFRVKLLNKKAITLDDLSGFSPELQDEIKKIKES